MKEKVRRNIIENKLVDLGDSLVVGVSGGHDSMSLMYILDDLKEEFGYKLIIAHVDHGVRGDLARRDRDFVESQARKLGLDFYSRQVDMDGYAKEHNISSEEAGRILRYGFFRDILKEEVQGKIVVGHNRNDQAETLIMRFIRGTGIDGLKGMDYEYKDIIRPILNITREEIENYIDEENIPVVIDHTNLENIYTRNKVRLDLIPYIEKEFNPNFINVLWTLSKNAAKDAEFLDAYTEEAYQRNLIMADDERIELDIEGIKSENIAISQRLIRLALEKLVGSLQGFGEVHISDVIDLLMSARTGKSINLPNKIKVSIDYDRLVISKGEKKVKIPEEYSYELKIGTNKLEKIGLNLKLEVVDLEDYKQKEISPNIRAFDYKKLRGSLSIRNRRPGDRFRPLGMKGSKKIKDYFIDEKISREKRNQLPLLVDEEEIIWVINHRISDAYKIDSKSKKILLVEIIRT